MIRSGRGSRSHRRPSSTCSSATSGPVARTSSTVAPAGRGAVGSAIFEGSGSRSRSVGVVGMAIVPSCTSTESTRVTPLGRRLRERAKEAIVDARESGYPLKYRERYLLLALANEFPDNPGGIWTSDARAAAKVDMTERGYYEARWELMRRRPFGPDEVRMMTRCFGAGQGSRLNKYMILATPDEIRDAIEKWSSTGKREVDA